MELLLLLPILLGYALYSSFVPDGTEDAAPTPTTTDTSDTAEPNVAVGTSGRDTISSGAGDDLVLGGSGADLIEGGGDWDALLGESGADTIFGGRGLDVLVGGAGNDVLYGLGDDDLLIGSTGDDLIYGGGGSDVLAATSGADTLYGDSGADVLSGKDNLPGSSPEKVLANNLTVSEAEGQQYLTSFDAFAGLTYTDKFTPQIADRVVAEVTRFDGTDLADDVLYGGNGNDILIGDFSDTLTGGAGNDRFSIFSDAGSDRVIVADFNPTEDVLRVFVGAGTNPAITLTNGATPADGVSVVIAGDTVAVLKGLTTANIPANLIQVIVG